MTDSRSQPSIEDLCFGLRHRAAELGSKYQTDIDFFRACADRLAELASARKALEEARESIALADQMVSEHIEKYHDFDYEPHHVPPELADLRNIEHHLMGSLILDEDIAALGQPK